MLGLSTACGGDAKPDAKKEAASSAKTEEPDPSGQPADTEGPAPTGEEAEAGEGEGAAEAGEGEAPAPDKPKLSEVGDDPIGVGTCDDFVKEWKACLEKAPGDARSEGEDELAEQIVLWRQTAEGGDDAKPALEIGCRTAKGRAKKTGSDWGCEWK